MFHFKLWPQMQSDEQLQLIFMYLNDNPELMINIQLWQWLDSQNGSHNYITKQ